MAALALLERQEAVLYARRAQALVDHRPEREAVVPARAASVVLELAVECGSAQVTASARLAPPPHQR
ncbi:MAG: hypothetical protein ACXVGH_04080 [Mycobacteriales bacterium]